MSQGITLDKSRVYADMTEIISGQKTGRDSDDQILLYSHMGMGAFDVACAHIAYTRAVEKGIGTWLDL